ncbi:MAG: GntR family transcriptional regulator, partial [Planctomycetota bacterium]
MARKKAVRKSEGPRYKHQMIASDILARIHSGEWGKGTKIPTIDELEKMYDYSRMTIFKAIQDLARQGYLSMVRGVGTFVERDRAGGMIGVVISEDVLHPQKAPYAFLLSRELRLFFEEAGHEFKLYIEPPNTEDAAEIPCKELVNDLREGRLAGLIATACDTPLYLADSPTWQEYAVPLVDATAHKDVPANGRISHDVNAAHEIALQV